MDVRDKQMKKNVLEYLDETVIKKPDKIAFSMGEGGIRFIDLYRQSHSIGTRLYMAGVYKKPVVVYMRRAPEVVAVFLGIVAAGCFYVPIDEEMPQERIERILENIASDVMICDSAMSVKARKLSFNGTVLLYDEIKETLENEAILATIREQAIDTDPVYVLYTSGSTGIPKGVVGCHRAVLNYIENLSKVLGFNEETVFGNQAPLHFDACMKDIYPTLKFGAMTYIIPKELFSRPVDLIAYLNRYQVNTLCWVASALTIVSSLETFQTIVPQYVKKIAFVGEVFPVRQLNKWRAVLPDVEYTNLYGPTEATGVSCYYKLDREFALDEVIPIGKPFGNTTIFLLTEENQEAKNGQEGEICICGTAVTCGYYNDLERTKAVFTQNPLNSKYPEIIYHTGDIGRYDENGDLIYISRKDFQIKHMGNRIELGEIEFNASMLDGINMAGCIYDEDKNRIVLCYSGVIPEREVGLLLREKLPVYMLPNRIIRLNAMPLTINGKIDRIQLKNIFKRGEK